MTPLPEKRKTVADKKIKKKEERIHIYIKSRFCLEDGGCVCPVAKNKILFSRLIILPLLATCYNTYRCC